MHACMQAIGVENCETDAPNTVCQDFPLVPPTNLSELALHDADKICMADDSGHSLIPKIAEYVLHEFTKIIV